MPNQNDVLNLSHNKYYEAYMNITEKIISKAELAKHLQKVWIGWAALQIYNKLERLK